ncbi:MAG: YdcF family protein [Thiomicrospira sp.]|uniref:YdcF family protein n=1 Tax=Thiomicrospira sp. TaxID=935 RepID=UPI0019EBCF19|nr:YdcF family protein [Thiomicrospira sp.]MBE0493652.1 YdcF family protein [Thiomicrospira sp.]
MDTVFFVLSKLGWMILSPGNLLVISFILGSVLVLFKAYSAAKWILMPTALAGALVLAYPVGDWLIQPLEKRFAKPYVMPEKVDGIIVLGGGEDLKRSLSWKVAELGLGGDRYIAAKKLADLYPDAPVIFTGGSGSIQLQDTGSEGEIAAQLFNDMGLKPDRLILESKSRNTFENFRNIQSTTRPGGQYLLVTSAYHMPRSVGIARQFGLHVIPYPVDYRSNSTELRRVDFDLFDHLKALEPGWREWIGLTVYYHTGKTSEWWPAPIPVDY